MPKVVGSSPTQGSNFPLIFHVHLCLLKQNILLFLHSIDTLYVSIVELFHQLFKLHTIMYIHIILELGTSACLRVIWFQN